MADTKKTNETGAAPTAASKAADAAAEERNVNLSDVTELPQGKAGAEIADNKGIVSNRVEGTQQREPKPEELPSDALIAPVAEQLMPNSKLTVGHLTKDQLPDLPGIDQEPDRNLKPDMSKVELPEGSEQGDVAERVEDEAKSRPENATREVRSRG